MGSSDRIVRNETGDHRVFRILSIDGGGIRGLIPGIVLARVEEEIRRHTNRPDVKIGECFDLVAGTSTGGILTCLYLKPDERAPDSARFSAGDGVELYKKLGGQIFQRGLWQRIRTLGGVTDERYGVKPLERILRQFFEDDQLKDLIRPCLITAFDTRTYRAVFFAQHSARMNPAENYFVRDVARATSAAPTYFEAAMPENRNDIPDAGPMIDGGVFANNPTACALVEAIAKLGVTDLRNVAILSLGTGGKTESITFEQCRNWGVAGWARPLINILMDGVAQTVDYQVRSLFSAAGADPDQYLRIDGQFDDHHNHLAVEGLDPAMDNASPRNIERLEQFARKLAERNAQRIELFVRKYL